MPRSRLDNPPDADPVFYGIYPCSLGLTLIATRKAGICALWFGDDAEALREECRARFKEAGLVVEPPEDRQGQAHAPLVAAALALIEAPTSPVAFPVDARGTPFQRRVWDALRRVTPGRTASYADIAREIGAPKATRAVAGACAANPVAVAIPCHRILRSDGALSGYRGGVERKRALLARENVTV